MKELCLILLVSVEVAVAFTPLQHGRIEAGNCRHSRRSLPDVTGSLLSRMASPTDGSGEQQQPSSSDKQHDYSEEETLLRIKFGFQQSRASAEARTALERYTQSFPFAAVLPVQPLMYLPTEDGGVQVTFLRKKTTEKPATDGGIRFFIRAIGAASPIEDPRKQSNVLRKQGKGSFTTNGFDAAERDGTEESWDGLELVAKRNSVGQSITKQFAEKLAVTAFLASLVEPSAQANVATTIPPPTQDFLHVQSIYHKWMDS